MDRYICVHGHFYQPPRENPWLEAIEVQDSAYPHHDWTRPVYFAVLIPHILLAALNVPFIILLVYRALKGDFVRHKRLARWVWPSWMFVSISGVCIYLMLYHL